MATKPSSEAESSEQVSTRRIKICESGMCIQKATGVEAFKGQLYELCPSHLRLIRKQKKADNNQ